MLFTHCSLIKTMKQAGAELCQANGNLKLFLPWLNTFLNWLSNMNIKRLMSKVFSFRLYPLSLVEVSKSQKNWLRIKFVSKENIGSERNLGSQKILGPKQLWVRIKILGPKQILGLKKFCFWKIFGSKKILSPKKNYPRKKF